MRTTYFHILLALHNGRRHGLGIADEVEANTGGSLRLGPGTLYRSLNEMSRKGLVQPVAAPPDSDPRRKFYTITEVGRKQLEVEARRFEQIVEIARRRRVLREAP